jgi:murein DD-endopeptidase MepM/ murein hydrolase activator NlpD
MKLVRILPPIVLILLVACAPAANSANAPQLSSTTPAMSLHAEAGSPTPEATTVSPTLTPTLQPMTEEPPSLPTATNGVMQLFFPTVIPVDGAEFRPPLYPVPWALSPYDHFYFADPIAATLPANPEWDYLYGGIFFGPDIIHTGIDLPAPRGTDVLAAGPGTVVWSGIGLFSSLLNNPKDPYGKAVAIRHDFGYQNQPLYTIYAHMDEIEVSVGQWVKTGDVIGKVGSTGLTTGPHLHFEVRLGENDFFFTRNPELWLSPPLGDGVLVGRITSTYGTILNSYLVILKSLATEKLYQTETYGPQVANSDAYYNENMVLSDLPAGVYELNIPYGALNRKTNIQILPGQVTYFSFHGYAGYDMDQPHAPGTATATP